MKKITLSSMIEAGTEAGTEAGIEPKTSNMSSSMSPLPMSPEPTIKPKMYHSNFKWYYLLQCFLIQHNPNLNFIA